MYGTLSTAVWILLVSSSILGYYAHHLIDDPPALDLERVGQRTPFGPPFTPHKSTPTASFTDNEPQPSEGAKNVAVPLHVIQASNGMAEEEDNTPDTDSDEPASIATIKYAHVGWIHPRAIARVADWLRWIGKSLAIVNAIGIIADSVFQYAGVFNNCFCDSSVYTLGYSAAFNVINPIASDIDLARTAWIGGLALALTSCASFVGGIFLIRDSLPS